MTLHELDSASAVNSFKSSNANTLICFSATWCGPCKASKPELESLASSYQQDPSVDVSFGIVYEHNLAEGIHEFGVRAFPTYILYTGNGLKMAGKIEGVNFEGIKQLITANGCKKDLGVGQSLGGDGSVKQLSPAEARAQRLAMFDKKNAPVQDTVMKEDDVTENDDENDKKEVVSDAKIDESTEAAVPMETEITDEKIKSSNDGNEDVEMKDAADAATAKDDEVEMVDPTTNLSIAHLDTLTGEMGFELLRAQKGLLYGTGGVEGAVEWLMSHQDDADIDEPIGLVPKGSTKSATPRTAEEIAAKVAEVKAILKANRDARAESEKVDDVERERQRRSMGQQMAKTREEMAMQARQREAKQRRKEKEAFKKERARIRAELEKDKAERRAHKGKLQSKLGIEGYNPDAIQYDDDGDGDDDKPKEATKKKPKANVVKIDEYISKVSAYRAGGDGGKCLKILLLYIKNVVDNPDEDKFKHINTESKAFKGKVKPFIGAKSLLLAVGFSPNEGGTSLDLDEQADHNVLAETRKKLEAALAAY